MGEALGGFQHNHGSAIKNHHIVWEKKIEKDSDRTNHEIDRNNYIYRQTYRKRGSIARISEDQSSNA